MQLILKLDKARASRISELTARQPIHLWFDFHGVKSVLHTNSPYLADHLRLGYGFFETTAVSAPRISLLALEAGEERFFDCVETLLPNRGEKNNLLIPVQMGLIVLLRDRSLLAYYTVIMLFGQVLAKLQKRFICLHAATLSYAGCGLIVCGAARCGKSVLTTILLQEGLGYSSDDVTLIARESFLVAPFPRAINIRDEYKHLIEPLLSRARAVRPFSVADQERLLVDFPEAVHDKVAPVMICFPQYKPESQTELDLLSPAMALVAMMNNRFHPLGESNDTTEDDFKILSEFVERVPSFALKYSDPVEAARRLNGLFRARVDACRS